MNKFLVINIGGSSTKLALFADSTVLEEETIHYDYSELKKYRTLWDQLEFRKKGICNFLKTFGINISDLSGIITRGPLIKPTSKGVYYVNEKMISDAKSGKYGLHPTNLGVKISYMIANSQLPIYTVDPPTSDELIDVARITGLPFVKRKSMYQVLNHHFVAREYAREIKKKYEDLDLVICHLGSGISVASHKGGRVIDVTNGLEGDGPMGLDRTGTIAAKDLLKLIKNHEYTVDELMAYQNGEGGIKAYLGTIDAKQIEKRIDSGSKKARLVYDSMAYQVAKAIGSASAALGNKPDAIILTGGLSNSKYFTSLIIDNINWIAPVKIIKEQNENRALVTGVLESLKNNNIKTYD